MSEVGPQSPYCPQCERGGDWFRVTLGHAHCTTCGTVMLEGRAAENRRVSDIRIEYPRYEAALAQHRRRYATGAARLTVPGRMTFTTLRG